MLVLARRLAMTVFFHRRFVFILILVTLAGMGSVQRAVQLEPRAAVEQPAE